MKLTAKIAAALVAGICIALLVNARAQIEEATMRHENDMRDNALDVGRLFRPTVARAWRTEGSGSALYLIQYINETLKANEVATRKQLRWVWLEDAVDKVAHPRVPLESLSEVVRGEEASLVSRGPDGDLWRYTYIPVSVGIDGYARGALEIAESTAPMRAHVAATRRKLLTSAALLAALCAGIVLLVGGWFVGRPLRELTRAAEAIGRGDLSVRVNLKQKDEVGSLGRTMNAMAEELSILSGKVFAQHEEKLRGIGLLRHADRLSSVGTFASGIAHELGTPLAVVSGRATFIADGTVTGSDAAEFAESIVKQADRMATTIRQLLDFARRGKLSVVRQPLAEILEPTLDLIRPLGRRKRVEIVFELPTKSLYIEADKTLLQQVFSNLLVNAIDAMPCGGTVTVSAAIETATPPADVIAPVGRFVCCHVQDEGEGMRPEVLPKLFEPFFTTKGVGKGTGLGLAVSYGIVSEHGGWIEVETKLGVGSRFSVYLPARKDESCTPHSPISAAAISKARPPR